MKQNYFSFTKTWLRFGLATAFATTLSFNLQAQTAPAKQWDKTYGGTNNETLSAMQQTTDGGFVLAGSSASNISGDKSQNSQGGMDYWVIKTDASGQKTWDKTFGGSASETLRDIQQTSDGGYILGGYSDSGISGDKSENNKGLNDIWIVKLDASGNKIWDKTIGGSNSEQFRALQQTSDGGYIIGGTSQSGVGGDKSQPSRGFMDYWIVKLNSNGTKAWDKTFGGSNEDFLNALQQTSDGGYILGGYSESGASGDKTDASRGDIDIWVLKLDANGNKVWDKTFGGNELDALWSLQQTSDGGYILGGDSDSGVSGDKSEPSRGSTDLWVIKIDANGNKEWDKTLGGDNYDDLFSIVQTSDGNFVMCGSSDSGISHEKTETSNGNLDFWVIKVTSTGSKLWDKTIGGNKRDVGTRIVENSAGGYTLGGLSFSDLGFDKSEANRGQSDFWLVKLGADITGLNETNTTFNLTVSPNPSQGKFKLQLSSLTTPSAEVTITDLLGRVVLQKALTVTDNQISEELILPAAKGLYLLQVRAGSQIVSRKIVVD